MKTLAVTLALIIATVATTFLGFLTWDAFSEEEPTWTEYQACIETVSHKELLEDRFFEDVFVDDPDEPNMGDMFRADPVVFDIVLFNFEIAAVEQCADLRPPPSTDE